jgi:nucleoside recognition membrane protein YjiH
MELTPYLKTFVATVVYTLFGLITFLIAFWTIVKISPFSIRKELEEDQNVALAILIASVILGIAYIIGSVLHG